MARQKKPVHRDSVNYLSQINFCRLVAGSYPAMISDPSWISISYRGSYGCNGRNGTPYDYQNAHTSQHLLTLLLHDQAGH